MSAVIDEPVQVVSPTQVGADRRPGLARLTSVELRNCWYRPRRS